MRSQHLPLNDQQKRTYRSCPRLTFRPYLNSSYRPPPTTATDTPFVSRGPRVSEPSSPFSSVLWTTTEVLNQPLNRQHPPVCEVRHNETTYEKDPPPHPVHPLPSTPYVVRRNGFRYTPCVSHSDFCSSTNTRTKSARTRKIVFDDRTVKNRQQQQQKG